jgi:hypothetical protein
MFDGMVGADGWSTYSNYWAAAAYGGMSYQAGTASTVVSSSSSSSNVGIFATRFDAASQLSVLVARNETCLGSATNADCGTSSNPPAAQDIPLTVTFPYVAPNSLNVVIHRIPFMANNAYLGGPWPITTPAITHNANGTWTLTLNGVFDGDAWTVALTPA